MSTKRIHGLLAIILTLSLVLTMIPFGVFASDKPTLSVKGTKVSPGELAEVTVNMENTPGIVNLILQVDYNEDVFTLKEVKDAGILGTAMHTQDYTLCPYQLTWENDTALKNFTENGKLVTLVFEVSEDAEYGDYDIGLSYDYDNWDIVNYEFQKVRFETVDGKITVEKHFDNVLAAANTNAVPGGKAAVDIMMENTPGIVNLMLHVNYDKDVFTLTDVKDGGILGTAMHTPNYSLCPYQLTWENDTALQNFTENGRLATLIFDVNPEAELGDYDITLSYDYDNWDIVNFEFEKVEFGLRDGVVTLVESLDPVITPIDEFDYEIEDGAIIIYEYLGDSEDVVIAEEYEIDGKTYTVVEIGDGAAFAENDVIKTLVIPATVEYIGDKAFYNCKELVEVTILGENTEIGEKALGFYKVDRKTDGITEGFTIKGYAGSTAEEYAAAEEEITFITLEKACDHSNTKTVDAVEATCMAEGYTGDVVCADCGELITKGEVIEKLPHAFGEWTVVTAATCMAKGSEKRVCTADGCTETETREIAINANAHTGNNTVVGAKDATCTAEGYTGDTVCECGATVATGETIDKLAHTYGQWTVVTAATCMAKGSEKRACTADGCTETETREIAINANAHTGNNTVVGAKDATCTAEGYTGDTVCECGATVATGETIEKLPHTEKTVNAKAATCSEAGYTGDVVCEVCGTEITKGEVIEKLAHTASAAVKENEVPATCTAAGSYDEVVYCSVCETEMSRTAKTLDKLAHTEKTVNAKAATCSEAGYTGDVVCEVCGTEITKGEVIEKLAHTASAAVKENEVPATCTAAGSYDEVVYCSVCETEMSRTAKTLDKLAHTEKTVGAKAATCSEAGYTGDVVCEVCGTEITKGEVIEKLAHTASAAVKENEVPATCTAAGSYDEVVYCSVCETEMSRTAKTLDKLAHTEKTVGAKAATCSEAGYTGDVVCEVCETEITKGEVIEKLAHTASAAVKENEVPATCTAAGSYDKVVYCSVCETEMSRTAKTLDKLAHTEKTVNAKAATCSEAGYTGDVVCEVCGTEITKGEVIEKLAHTASAAVKENEVPATCTAAGSYDEVVYCSVCETEMSRTAKTLDKLAHTEKTVNAKAATCSEAGYTGDVVCEVCGTEITKGEVIEKLAHTASAAVKENEVPASCTAAGSYDEVVYCSVCETEMSRTAKTLDKLAHTEKTVGAKAATCSEAGYTGDVVCEVCGTEITKGEVIEKLAHTASAAVKENEVPATCTAAGSYDEVVYCSVCETEMSRTAKTLDKLAHTEKTVNAKAATCSEAGYTGDVVCEVCGTEITKGEVIEKLAHTASAAVKENEVPATCTAAGSYDEVVYCSVCETEMSRTAKTLDKLAHTEKTVNAKAATCSEAGYTGDVVCEVCGTEITKGEVIEKLAHTASAAVKENEVPATCTAAGSYDEVVYCSVCETEMSRTEKTLDKLAHTEKTVNAKAATCSEAGYTGDVACEVCGTEITKGEVIEKLAHTEKTVGAKAATCTEAGYTGDVVCEVCGTEITKGEVIEKLAHTEKTVNAKAATCKEAGYTGDVVCEVCGTEITKGEVIEKLAHTEKTVGAKAATCKEAGYTGDVVCAVCGTVITKGETIEKLAHTEKTIEGAAATCTTSGLTSGVKCSFCGTVLVAQTKIDALGHDYKLADKVTDENGSIYNIYVCNRCSDSYEEFVAYGIDEAIEAMNKAKELLANDSLGEEARAEIEKALNELEEFLGEYIVFDENGNVVENNLPTDNAEVMEKYNSLLKRLVEKNGHNSALCAESFWDALIDFLYEVTHKTTNESLYAKLATLIQETNKLLMKIFNTVNK